MVLRVDGSEDKDLRQVISENGQAKRMAHFIRLAQFLRIKIMLFPPGQVRNKIVLTKIYELYEFLLIVREFLLEKSSFIKKYFKIWNTMT